MAKRPTTTSKTAAAKPKAAPRKPRSAETKVAPPGPSLPSIERDAAGRISQKDAAALLGVDDRTIRNWRNNENCPALYEGGAVDFPRLSKWLIERAEAPLRAQLERRADDEDEDGPSIKQLQKRSMQSANRLQDIKVQEAIGEFVPRSVMFHHLSTALSDVTSRLRPLGVHLGPILSVEKSAAGCTRIVDDGIDKVLRELVVDVIMDMGKREIDPFEQADLEAAEAERQAEKELEREPSA